MLRETRVKNLHRRSKVTMICLGLGIVGLLGTWFHLVQSQRLLWDHGVHEFDDGFWVLMSAGPLFNPLCWAGLYGIYRWMRASRRDAYPNT